MGTELTVAGIDPGFEVSHLVIVQGGRVCKALTFDNVNFRELFFSMDLHMMDGVCIEQIASYGMAAGAELFETCFWTGRFTERLELHRAKVARAKRKTIVAHVCKNAAGKDNNVRQAMIDRFGPPKTETWPERFHGKTGAPLPRKKVLKPGPTHGITADQWQALAVAAYAIDKITGAV